MINILIVDDNTSKLDNIKKIIIEDSNIPLSKISLAKCTKEAKQLLYKNYFDLMILDLVLPVEADGEADAKFGLKLLEEIPMNPSIKSPIHIIGLTGFSEIISKYHESFSKKLWNLIDYEADSYAWQDKVNSIVQHLVRVRKQYLESMTERKGISSTDNKDSKKRIFIGSSVEGLNIARTIQMNLEHDAICEIWNEGAFEVGDAYIESLESALNRFDYGLFIFTPDDDIVIRGEKKKIARDNVIFELGMFVGKISRRKAFIVHPKTSNLHLLSDMDGVSKLSYDASIENKQSALGPTCQKIRLKINKQN